MGCGASVKTYPVPYPEELDTKNLQPATASSDRPLILLLHSAAHLPSLDWTSESDPYALAHASRAGQQVGNKVRWSYIANCSHPCWNTAHDLGCRIGDFSSDPAVDLRIELWDHDPLKHDECIGQVEINTQTLEVDTWYDKPLVVADSAARKIAKTSSPQIPSMRFMILSEPREIKQVFFVRHGESMWNRAQKERNVGVLLGQVDHPLTLLGWQQCIDLEAKLAAADNHLEAGGDMMSKLLAAEVVLASPLTRAVQTALIGIRPLLKRTGVLRLCRNAREKRNLGGRDNTGTARGAEEIFARARKSLSEAGAPESDLSEYFSVRIDATESQNRWWSDKRESNAEAHQRIDDFLRQLRYLREERVVVVGHSFFFRELFKCHLQEGAMITGTDAAGLTSRKMMNCGVAGLTMDFTGGLARPISQVELLLDTKMV